MLKAAGTPCPVCNELFPAEYVQMEGPARWTCLKCNATGELSGPILGREAKKAAPLAPKPTYKGLVRGLFLFLGLVLFADYVMGGNIVARQGENWVRLTQEECRIPAVVENLLRNKLDVADFRHGYGNIKGRDWKLCWLRAPFGAVLVFEDGDVRQLRSEEMHDEPGV